MTIIEWGFVVALGSIVLYFVIASMRVYPFQKREAKQEEVDKAMQKQYSDVGLDNKFAAIGAAAMVSVMPLMASLISKKILPSISEEDLKLDIIRQYQEQDKGFIADADTAKKIYESRLQDTLKQLEALERFSKPLEQLSEEQMIEVYKNYNIKKLSLYTKIIKRLANLSEEEFQKILSQIDKNDVKS